MADSRRRSIRLQGYDYRVVNAYFVTICVEQRRRMFGDVADSQVRLSHVGEVVDECWQAIPQHFPHAALDLHVVMPDHLHGLLIIETDARSAVGKQSALRAGPGSLPVIVRHFKAAVTRTARQRGLLFGALWQRNYYEHVVRNDADLARVRKYIVDNPLAWEDARARYDWAHEP